MVEKKDRKKGELYTRTGCPLLICIEPKYKKNNLNFDAVFLEIYIEPFSTEISSGHWSIVEPFSVATIRENFKFKKLERGLIKAVFLAQKMM
jgi:hypothetical protein